MNRPHGPMRVFESGSSCVLRPDHFVAAGGEGQVFAKGPHAYKVFHDPSTAPPLSKLAELTALRVPQAVLPLAPLFDAPMRDPGAVPHPIGYRMDLLSHTVSWGQACTHAHKARTGVGTNATFDQIETLRRTLLDVHAQGCAVVDLSENNVVLDGPTVRLIDVDSWQTPSHLASAITPSVASPFSSAGADGRYGPAQDWFAFAVLSFSRLIGIHPFKGKHPRVRGLQARMAAGLSVLAPGVRTPPMCPPPRQILPPQLLQWFDHAFSGQGQIEVPPCFDATDVPRGRRARRPAPVDLRLWCQSPSPIRGVLVAGRQLHVVTAQGVHDESGAYWLASDAVLGLGMTDRHEPFALLGPLGRPTVVVRGLPPVPLVGPIEDVCRSRDTLFVRTKGRVCALDVRRLGKRSVPVLRDVVSVLPRATRMFEGLLVQDLFGQARISVLGHAAGAPSFDLATVTGPGASVRPNDLLDARADGDRLVLCSHSGGGTREDVLHLDPRGLPVAHQTQLDTDGLGTTFAHTALHLVELRSDGLHGRAHAEPAPGAPPVATPGRGTLSTDGVQVVYASHRAVYRWTPSTQLARSAPHHPENAVRIARR